MKKIIFAVLGLAALGFSSFSWGVPVFTGSTSADFGETPGAAVSNAAGFYIWSDASRTDWSLRWTGNDYGVVHAFDWSAIIELTNLVDGSVSTYHFNDRDSVSVDSDIAGTDRDSITVIGRSGSGWDGIDFSIVDSTMAALQFELSGTMFNGMTSGLAAQEGLGVYVGQDFTAPMVQVLTDADGRVVQRFSTAAVPEPASLLLLATGLLGMGASRIRRRKA